MMGRPKLPEGQKGTQINLRIPPAALKYLKDQAAKEGRKPAALAKDILMAALATRIFRGE